MFSAGYYNAAARQELASDLWIQRNIPGGLNSPMGAALDNYYGGNPNPTFGQLYGTYGLGYGYYRAW